MSKIFSKTFDNIALSVDIKSEFEKSGGKIVEYASYNDGDKDFSAQLTNVKKSNPDIIALPDYYNVVSLIADQARKAGIEVPFIGGDGWDSPELINIGGDSLEGSIFVNHYSPDDTDELVQNFVNKYKDKYGSNPDAFAALTYSTIQLYQAAIEKAGSTNGDTIKDALVNIDTVTVTDSKGNVIEVTKTADNEFSFVMPGSQVSVDITFKEINDSPKKTPTPSSKDDWWFDDVAENEWYYAPIKSAYDNGLMSGVSDTEFAPDTDITRGMFVTVLHRIDGETKSDVDYTFTDVNENDYFSNAVAWGSENNIISGYSDTEFAPNDNITREQMVSILKRFAEYKQIDTSIIDTLDSYSDTEDISDYAVSAFQWACGNEIISGFTDNTLRPKANTTRAQAAAVFNKIYSIK